MVFKYADPQKREEFRMMKRLLPVAAAVVIGLTPSLAANAGMKGGKVVHHAAHAANDSNVTKAMHCHSANFGSGKGVSLADGKWNMAVSGGVGYLYESDLIAIHYANSGLVDQSSANASSSASRLIAGVVLDNHFRLADDFTARATFTAGPTLRSKFAEEINVATSGATSHFDVTDHTGSEFGLRLENAYMTYDFGSGFGLRAGLVQDGVLGTADLSPTRGVAHLDDLFEFGGLQAGVFYHGDFDGHQIDASFAIVDPGYDANSIDNSRGEENEFDAKISNWAGHVQYSGKFGDDLTAKVGFNYLDSQMDLTQLNAMNGQEIVITHADDSDNVWAIYGGVDWKNFGFDAFYLQLGNNAAANSSTSNGGDKDWTTNDVDMFGLNLNYKMDEKTSFHAHFGDTGNMLAGLPDKMSGLSASYMFAKDVTAKLEWDHGSAAPAANSSKYDVFGFSLSFKL